MECGTDTSQKHSGQYPVLVRMAWDFLPIQGLSTPSERAFSNASLTNDLQCNQLTPETFEALQILKSAYCHGHMSAPAEAEKYYCTITSVLGDPDGDVECLASSFL